MPPAGKNMVGSKGGCGESTAVDESVNNQISYSSLTGCVLQAGLTTLSEGAVKHRMLRYLDLTCDSASLPTIGKDTRGMGANT
jgi:hypothetical protein